MATVAILTGLMWSVERDTQQPHTAAGRWKQRLPFGPTGTYWLPAAAELRRSHDQTRGLLLTSHAPDLFRGAIVRFVLAFRIGSHKLKLCLK